MTRRQRRVTSADVAREAGVSRATVSYVLNDTPHQTIPEATRQRVLDAAARLGYAPSARGPDAAHRPVGRGALPAAGLADRPRGGRPARQPVGRARPRTGSPSSRTRAAARTGRSTEIWKAITPAAVIAFEDFSRREERVAMRAAGVELVVALFGAARPGGASWRCRSSGSAGCRPSTWRRPGTAGWGTPAPTTSGCGCSPSRGLDGVPAGVRRPRAGEPVLSSRAAGPEAAADAVSAWRGAGVTAVCAYNDEVALAVLAGLRALG